MMPLPASALLTPHFLAASETPAAELMGWGNFVALIAGAAVLLAVLASFIRRREPWDLESTPQAFRSLQRAYDRTLRTLKDLEFDLQVGSLSANEHAQLKAEYKAKAVELRGALERARLAAVRRIASGARLDMSPEERKALEDRVARARSSLKEMSHR